MRELPPVLLPFLDYTERTGGNLDALAVMARVARDFPADELPPGHVERLCRLVVCPDHG